MNLRHLLVFIAVVECGGITRAAEKLFIAQPSVSQTIADMENEYNVILFERLNKKLHLTSLGKDVYTRAKTAVKNFENIDEILKDETKINRVSIGGTVTLGNCVFPYLLRHLKNEGAAVENVLVENTASIVRSVEDGSLDFALVEGKTDSAEIVWEVLCFDELLLVCGSEFADSEPQKHCVILREKGSGTRELAEQYLISASIFPQKIWQVSSTEAIKNLLCAYPAATVISSRIVATEVRQKKLAVLARAQNRSFYIIHHKDKKISPTLEKFMEQTKRIVKSL